MVLSERNGTRYSRGMTAPTIRRIGALLVAVFGLIVLPLAAQTTLADPNDPIYADIDAWATKGS